MRYLPHTVLRLLCTAADCLTPPHWFCQLALTVYTTFTDGCAVRCPLPCRTRPVPAVHAPQFLPEHCRLPGFYFVNYAFWKDTTWRTLPTRATAWLACRFPHFTTLPLVGCTHIASNTVCWLCCLDILVSVTRLPARCLYRVYEFGHATHITRCRFTVLPLLRWFALFPPLPVCWFCRSHLAHSCLAPLHGRFGLPDTGRYPRNFTLRAHGPQDAALPVAYRRCATLRYGSLAYYHHYPLPPWLNTRTAWPARRRFWFEFDLRTHSYAFAVYTLRSRLPPLQLLLRPS